MGVCFSLIKRSLKQVHTDCWFSCSVTPQESGSFFSSRTSILRRLAFCLHGYFLMIVRWLPQLKHHVFKQTSSKQERKDEEKQRLFPNDALCPGNETFCRCHWPEMDLGPHPKSIPGEVECVYWLLGLEEGPPLLMSWNLCFSTEMGFCSWKRYRSLSGRQQKESVHHRCQCEPLHLLKKGILSYPRTTYPVFYGCQSIHNSFHLSPGLLPLCPHWPPAWTLHTHVDTGWIQYWLSPPCSIGMGFSKIIYGRLSTFRLNYPMVTYYGIRLHLSQTIVKRLSSLIFQSAFVPDKSSSPYKVCSVDMSWTCINSALAK